MSEFSPLSGNNSKLSKVESSRKLTKTQQQFKRLTERIEALKFEIAAESEKLEVLTALFRREVQPQYAKIAESQIKVAVAMDRATGSVSFTKKQQQQVGDTVVALLNEAFEHVNPTDEHKALYNKWASQSYGDTKQEQLQQAKEMFADMMWNRYGVEVDTDDIEDSTEGFYQFKERMKREQEEARKDFFKQHAQKSKKQQEKEELQKAKEELKLKGIRSIYIALAKVLHPDNEMDPAAKVEKEELMKQAIAAYEQNDLQALLMLEMEWIHKNVDNISTITDEKLRVYLSALRQQVSDLETEKLSITHSAVYQPVAQYASMPINIAKSRILKAKKELKEYCGNLLSVVAACRGTYAKHYVLEFADYYLERIQQHGRNDDWEQANF